MALSGVNEHRAQLAEPVWRIEENDPSTHLPALFPAVSNQLSDEQKPVTIGALSIGGPPACAPSVERPTATTFHYFHRRDVGPHPQEKPLFLRRLQGGRPAGDAPAGRHAGAT
jgi:hypothetical protein